MAPVFVPGIPIYVQIVDDARARILRDTLHTRDQPTPTTEYSVIHRINPATVGKVLAIPVDEGLVDKQCGIGVLIVEGVRRALTADGLASYMGETLNPAVKTGLALGLDIDPTVNHVRAYGTDLRTKKDL